MKCLLSFILIYKRHYCYREENLENVSSHAKLLKGSCSLSELQQGPEICDVISAKHYWNTLYWVASHADLLRPSSCRRHPSLELLHPSLPSLKCWRRVKLSGFFFSADEDEYMSLYSHVTGSTTQSAVEAESNRSLTTPKSLPSHSGTSGIHETDTRDIHSIFSDDLELNQCKSPPVSSAKTQSHKGTLSTDVQSDVRSQASAGFFGSPLSRCQSRSIPPSRQSLRKNPDAMTDFEREFFSEDYMSGDEGDEENFMNNSFTPSGPEDEPECGFGSEKYKDFLRCLPVHLSKRILGMLDKNSLTNCLCLSKHWRVLAEEVKQDYMVHQIMTEEIMLMQVSFCIKRMYFSIKCTPIYMDGLLA